MKVTALVLTLLLSAAAAFSQGSIRDGLRVNGVALGNTYQQVVRKLGKPTGETRRKADECVGGTELTLTYPGLKIQLWDDANNPKKFTVGWFEVRSPKWNVSGVKVGQTSADVKKLFGKPSSEQTEKGSRIWFYDMSDESPGSNSFGFRGGKLATISVAWEMC